MSNFISRFSDKLDNKLGAAFNRITGHLSAAERREQANQVNEQVKAYKEQSNLAKSELDRVRGEQATEKRRINEKQIKQLRRHFRPAGLLDHAREAKAEQPIGGINQNLGG